MRVTLSWKASADSVQGYHIYRARGAGRFMLLASTPELSYTDRSVARRQSYSYYVVAFIGKATSPASNIVTLPG